MSNANLSDANWARILAFLRTRKDLYIVDEKACRRFVEAVLWILRSGCNPSSAQAKQPMVLTLNRHWRQYQ
ncbi:MAG: Putative transposase of IS4/5 family (DUF4096), partial [Candidatus Kentron sp. G]